MNGYSSYIENLIAEYEFGKIFSSDIIADKLREELLLPREQAREVANNKLKRMADGGVISRIQKGTYYKPQQTVFGAVKPNLTQYTLESLTRRDGRTVGYETGISFMNRIGLTTLIPKNIEVATNHYQRKDLDKYHITVKRPVTVITDENYKYLQMLDVIDLLPDVHTDTDVVSPLRTLLKKQKLNPLTLVFTARKYYPVKTTMRAIDIFMYE